MLGGLLKGRPARPTRPKDPLDAAIFDAEARVSVTTENLRDADRRAQEAHAALTRATAAGRAAVARYDAVCLDTPDDAKKLAEADEGSKKAHRALEAARTAAVDADAALHAVQRAHAEAGEELSRARREKRVAALRGAASIERLQAELGPAVERFLALEAEQAELLERMDAAHARSVAASTELRELGEGVVDAGPLQLLAPFILAAVGDDPALASALRTEGIGSVSGGPLCDLHAELAPVYDGPRPGEIARRELPRVLPKLRAYLAGVLDRARNDPHRSAGGAVAVEDLAAALRGRNLDETIRIFRDRRSAR